jgi:hypothetical protein
MDYVTLYLMAMRRLIVCGSKSQETDLMDVWRKPGVLKTASGSFRTFT